MKKTLALLLCLLLALSLTACGDDHYLQAEIAYHPEPDLTGNHSPVLHIHYYNHDFTRSDAEYLDRATFEKYRKYLIGREWYD